MSCPSIFCLQHDSYCACPHCFPCHRISKDKDVTKTSAFHRRDRSLCGDIQPEKAALSSHVHSVNYVCGDVVDVVGVLVVVYAVSADYTLTKMF